MLRDFAVPQLDTDNDSVKRLMATPVLCRRICGNVFADKVRKFENKPDRKDALIKTKVSLEKNNSLVKKQ